MFEPIQLQFVNPFHSLSRFPNQHLFPDCDSQPWMIAKFELAFDFGNLILNLVEKKPLHKRDQQNGNSQNKIRSAAVENVSKKITIKKVLIEWCEVC